LAGLWPEIDTLCGLGCGEGSKDRVLLDAPCSGLGVLRRRPDARWRVLPGDVRELATLQRALLEFGYGVEVTSTYGTGLEKVVEAFQRHFRTERIDGRADSSTIETLNRLLTAHREQAIA
jgi:hypothetical protein